MFKRITNEQEYYYALNRVEKLMFRVKPGTEEAEELETLTKLVEEFENKQNLYLHGKSKFSGHDLINSVKNKRY